jgi:hypothetical protein
MKYIVFALFAGLLMAACKNTPSPTPAIQPPEDSLVTKDFFPVSEYIGGQLTVLIDSFRYPLTKIVTISTKSSLSAVTDEEFRQLAQDFRLPDINDPAIKKFYTETNIADQSSASVTLNYSTTNSSLPLQKVEVYIQADPVANDKVSGIYMEKFFTRNDTSFNQKLYWKTAKNMQVITEKKVKDKLLPIEKIKIAWDPSE